MKITRLVIEQNELTESSSIFYAFDLFLIEHVNFPVDFYLQWIVRAMQVTLRHVFLFYPHTTYFIIIGVLLNR